jgi:hypothetical protein
LHPDVLERRPAKHRLKLTPNRRLAQGRLEFVRGHRFVSEEFLGERFVGFADAFDQLGPGPLGAGQELCRNIADLEFGAQLGFVKEDPAHLEQVDYPLEGDLAADGPLHGDGRRVQPVGDGGDAGLEIGPGFVHLVDEADARHVVLVGLAPDGFALCLDPFLGIEDRDGSVEHAQAALHLGGEIDVSGGVDQVDGVALPRAGDRRRIDGDATLLFLLVEVGDGGAVVHLAHAMAGPGIEQDALGGGGLAGVDVRRDPDIAN